MTRQRYLSSGIPLLMATAVASLALLTTGCSAGADAGDGGKSGKGDEKSSGAVSEEGKEEDQALAHRKCLREQGLNVPEPKAGEGAQGLSVGGGVSKEQLEKALKACQDKAGPGRAKEMTQADKDKAVKFAQCMRKNGVDMPDPDFDGGAVAGLKVPEDAAGKQKFEKAIAACESVTS